MGGLSSGGHQVIWNLVRAKGIKLDKEERVVDGNRFIHAPGQIVVVSYLATPKNLKSLKFNNFEKSVIICEYKFIYLIFG